MNEPKIFETREAAIAAKPTTEKGKREPALYRATHRRGTEVRTYFVWAKSHSTAYAAISRWAGWTIRPDASAETVESVLSKAEDLTPEERAKLIEKLQSEG